MSEPVLWTRLNEGMARAGLGSYRELAIKSGVSLRTIMSWSKWSVPGDRTLKAVAAALGVPWRFLRYGERTGMSVGRNLSTNAV